MRWNLIGRVESDPRSTRAGYLNDSDRWPASGQGSHRQDAKQPGRKKMGGLSRPPVLVDPSWHRGRDAIPSWPEPLLPSSLQWQRAFLLQPAFLRPVWLPESARPASVEPGFRRGQPEWLPASGLPHRRQWWNLIDRLLLALPGCSCPSWAAQHSPVATLHMPPATHRSVFAWKSLAHSQKGSEGANRSLAGSIPLHSYTVPRTRTDSIHPAFIPGYYTTTRNRLQLRNGEGSRRARN